MDIIAVIILFVLTFPFSFLAADFVTEWSKRNAIQLYLLRQCENGENNVVQIKNIVIHMPRPNVYTYDGIVTIREPLNGPFFITMEMTKCSLRDNPSTCERYTPIKMPMTVCNGTNVKWTGLFSTLENFEAECPLMPGTYRFKNNDANVNHMASLPDVHAYWKFKQIMTNATDSIKLFCLEIEVNIVPRRPFRSRKNTTRATSTAKP